MPDLPIPVRLTVVVDAERRELCGYGCRFRVPGRFWLSHDYCAAHHSRLEGTSAFVDMSRAVRHPACLEAERAEKGPTDG